MTKEKKKRLNAVKVLGLTNGNIRSPEKCKRFSPIACYEGVLSFHAPNCGEVMH